MNKVTLKDIASSQTGPFGSQLHESDYVEEGIPIVTVEHLGESSFTHQNLPFVSEADRDRLSKYILREGDIVFSRVGSVDRSTYVSSEEDGWLFSGRCIRVRVDETKAAPRYISFYFRQKAFKEMMVNISVGATMPSLNTKLMDDIPITLPDRPTQEKVASVLSTLDDKIELNNKINAELEAMAKILYDYWFVQFDFLNEEGKPYKSSGGRMVYNEVLKREIPKGWDVHRLSKLTSFLSRGISPKYIEEEDGIPVLNQKCIREHRVLYEFQRRHDNEAKRASSKLIKKFDVLVNSTGVGTLGRVALVRWLNEEQVTVDSHVTIVRALEKKINRVFFGYSLLTKQAEIENFANGSTGQVELNRSQLSDITLLVPPTKFQNKFHEFYEPIIKKTAINERQNQELAQLRDWLLPMLMNGQVKITDNSNSDNDEHSIDTPKGINIAAEPTIGYQKLDLSAHNASLDRDSRFEAWLSQQGLAARGDIDTATLREIFDAMDDDDK